VLKALEKDPAKRYPSVLTFAESLKTALTPASPTAEMEADTKPEIRENCGKISRWR
jgi:hypothetical protein